MLKRITLLTIAVIILASAASLSYEEPRAARPELDLGQFYKYSSWAAGSMAQQPTIEAVVQAFGLVNYIDVVDANGANALEIMPVMKPCCIPGVSGTLEHLLQLYLLETKKDDIRYLAGLMFEVTGYCTLSDVASDFVNVVLKAEFLRNGTSDSTSLKESIMKAMVVAHYRWYMAGAKGAQAMTVSLAWGLDFTLFVDPQAQTIRLMWPGTVPGATSMQESVESYDRYLSDDKLGIEAIISTNYNSMALSCEEAESGVWNESSGTT